MNTLSKLFGVAKFVDGHFWFPVACEQSAGHPGVQSGMPMGVERMRGGLRESARGSEGERVGARKIA